MTQSQNDLLLFKQYLNQFQEPFPLYQFSGTDEEIIAAIKKAIETNKKVTIKK